MERVLFQLPAMETRQRHAEPYFPPWTDQWPRRRQLGFGVLAFVPLLLLSASFLAFSVRAPLSPVLVYIHVGSQFITLLLFGHLMIANPHLSSTAKAAWSVGFLFLAPFVIPLYWAIHVWNVGAHHPMPSELDQVRGLDREVHVYDYDYTAAPPEEAIRRPDGAIVHRLHREPPH